MNRIIENYISRLNVNDIKSFAANNGITLDDEELNLVYNYIINDWKTICYGNPRGILDDLKNKLNSDSYNKIEQLYSQFKNRYL